MSVSVRLYVWGVGLGGLSGPLFLPFKKKMLISAFYVLLLEMKFTKENTTHSFSILFLSWNGAGLQSRMKRQCFTGNSVVGA